MNSQTIPKDSHAVTPADYDICAFQAKDLLPFYKHLREEAPVARFRDNKGNLFWAVSRYEDVLHVLKTPRIFGAGAFTEMFQPACLRGDYKRDLFFVGLDGEEHKKRRALMSDAFSAKSVGALAPFMKETADKILSTVPIGETVTFMEQIGYPYISTITNHITGIPEAFDHTFVTAWLEMVHKALLQPLNDAETEEMRQCILAQNKKFAGIIEKKRQTSGADVISSLTQAELDGQPLSEVDLLNALELIYASGFHTSVQMVSRAVVFLARNPAVFSKLKALPVLVPSFVEEILRHQALIPAVAKKITEDTTLCGTDMKAGDKILCLLGAANHDPSVFPDPDTFNLERRNVRKHLAFGRSDHLCMGAELARQQVAIIVRAIVKKFNAIDCPPDKDLSENNQWTIRYLTSLPVTFS